MTASTLPAQLSQALVAFTVEFDNEFEHRMPHRTTDDAGRTAAARGAPWLVSQVMWANVMRHVDPCGVRVEEVAARARLGRVSLLGLRRWRYLDVDGEVIRPTAAGRRAQEVWRPLAEQVEGRWRARHGAGEVEALRSALEAVVDAIDVDLPDYLPVVEYGLASPALPLPPRPARGDARPDLSALLSQALLAFVVPFERRSRVSLAIHANALRVMTPQGVRVGDLPRLTGVSKEAIAMSLTFLQRRDLAAVEPDPTAARGRVAHLSPSGEAARESGARILATVEDGVRARLGGERVDRLRAALDGVAGDPDTRPSPLLRGLDPHPDGWRASVRRPEVLPHHPTVLHRGGYPDGS